MSDFGLTIYERPETPGFRFLRYKWKDDAGHIHILESDILEWNCHATAGFLRRFSDSLKERAPEMESEAKQKGTK